MIFYLDETEARTTPRPETLGLLESRMNKSEIAKARAEIKKKIEGTRIQTSSWMPGSDWTGTVFQPIFEKAAMKNQTLAAQIFGLLVFDVFRCDDQKWYVIRTEDVKGLVYFQEGV